MVELIADDGQKRKFDKDHAERILGLVGTSWSLPADSDLVYQDGKISKKTSTKKPKAKTTSKKQEAEK